MSTVSAELDQASQHNENHLANLTSLSQGSAQTLKTDLVRQACQDRDIDRLIHLTETPGGLLNDSLRQTACKHCVTLECLVEY